MTDFDIIWKQYPRKTNRMYALKCWNRLNPDTATVQKMIDALKWQTQTRQWKEGRIPHCSTWLNQERWEDEPWEPPTAQSSMFREADQRRAKTQEMRQLLEQGFSRVEAENKVYH